MVLHKCSIVGRIYCWGNCKALLFERVGLEDDSKLPFYCEMQMPFNSKCINKIMIELNYRTIG